MKLKRWFIVGLIIMIAGFTLVSTLVITNGFDIFKREITENTYEITDSFESIDLSLRESDVTIKVSKDGTNKVVARQKKNYNLEVSVIDGILTIKETKNNLFNLINFSSCEFDLYVTKQVFDKLLIDGSTSDVTLESGFKFKEIMIDLSTGDVKLYDLITDKLSIEVSTGSKCLKNLNVDGDVYIKSSTGKTNIENMTCDGKLTIIGSTSDTKIDNCTAVNIVIELDTGDCDLSNVISSENLNIKIDTGDVELDSCDGANIYIITSTGDVEGTILSGKTFDIHTSTGSISKPDNRNGGICQVRTSTGDIELSYN